MGKISRDELHRIAERSADSGIQKKASVKAYLQQLETIEISIRQRQKQVEELRAEASGVHGMGYDSVRVQTSTSGDTMAKAVSRYVDMEKEISERLWNFRKMQDKIIGEIQGLKKPEYVALLHKRYVEYKRLELIAVEMNFSYEYTRKMHGRALQEFGRVYNITGTEKRTHKSTP